MNYHYIEYMLKERQREELEACERRRLLEAAGHPQAGLIHKAFSGLTNFVRRFKEQQTLRHKRLHACVSMVHKVAEPHGEGQ